MNLSKRLLAAIALLFSLNPSFGQTVAESEQIMVRSFEFYQGLYFSSEIVISYGNEKTERIELEILKSKNLEKNTDRLNYVINKIRKSGYKMLTSHGGGDGAMLCSTYIFIKE